MAREIVAILIPARFSPFCMADVIKILNSKSIENVYFQLQFHTFHGEVTRLFPTERQNYRQVPRCNKALATQWQVMFKQLSEQLPIDSPKFLAKIALYAFPESLNRLIRCFFKCLNCIKIACRRTSPTEHNVRLVVGHISCTWLWWQAWQYVFSSSLDIHINIYTCTDVELFKHKVNNRPILAFYFVSYLKYYVFFKKCVISVLNLIVWPWVPFAIIVFLKLLARSEALFRFCYHLLVYMTSNKKRTPFSSVPVQPLTWL